MKLNEITDAIIGAAIEVPKHLGPGLLESAYEAQSRVAPELQYSDSAGRDKTARPQPSYLTDQRVSCQSKGRWRPRGSSWRTSAELLVSGCNSAKMLEATKQTLYFVSVFVALRVQGVFHLRLDFDGITARPPLSSSFLPSGRKLCPEG